MLLKLLHCVWNIYICYVFSIGSLQWSYVFISSCQLLSSPISSKLSEHSPNSTEQFALQRCSEVMSTWTEKQVALSELLFVLSKHVCSRECPPLFSSQLHLFILLIRGVSADEAVLGANIDAETLHNSLGYRLVYLKRLALSAQSPLFVLLA